MENLKYVRIIDENGIFIEDVFVEEITANTIEIPCPPGFCKPRWDGVQWVEGLTQEEIDALNNVPHELTLEDRVTTTETKVVTIEETIDVLFGGTV